MTPEEKAVIDAAIEWWNAGRELDNARLGITIESLLAARAAEERGAPDEMLWVERTWRDVRAGDTVRPPGSDATAVVKSSATQDWHVDPVNVNWTEVVNESGEVKRVPMPIPLEYSSTLVYFQAAIEPRVMNPDAPVEIQLSRREVAAADMFGWPGRIGVTYDGGKS